MKCNAFTSINKIKALTWIICFQAIFVGCGQSKKSNDTANNKKLTDTSMKSEEEWKKSLTAEQYYILREKGTERPFTGKFYLHKEKGVYTCAGCGAELFTDEMKFDSHCGWPSFDREIAGGKIKQHTDTSHGMVRTEITCARCGGHLGHIFDDGPTNTGLRYCVNSVSLSFISEADYKKKTDENAAKNMETITLGGGCFWCIEAVFLELDGVSKVESGYSGGTVKNPSYEAVCSGSTNHAEVVQVTFDKSKVSLEQVLKVFFTVHDPTTLNRQGNDLGTQYRSVIFYHNTEQKEISESVIAALTAEKVYENPIVTKVEAFQTFYKAEDYHQNYYNNNQNQPYCKMVVKPKVEKFEKAFKNLKRTH